MKTKLLLFILFVPFILSSQTINNRTTISGFVTYKNDPLPGAIVRIKNTNKSVKTDFKGFYKIQANVGEIITFDYIKLKQKEILIEDITNILNIELKLENLAPKLHLNKEVKLGGSSISSTISGFELVTIDVNTLNKNASTLTEALLEKVPAFFTKQNKYGENIIYLKGQELKGPVLWEIDGFGYDIPFPIFMKEVKSLFISQTELNGCVIKVETTINYNKIKEIDFDNYYFSDEDYYNYDAILYESQKKYEPEYLNIFENISNSKEALQVYEKQYPTYKNTTNFHFTALNYFQKKYNDKNLLLKVLADFEKYVGNNPEDLKAIAYKYQELNENNKALTIYRKIANYRPNYAQSYRDLANCFADLNDYKNFWLIYATYLKKGFKIDDNDIGEIMASELMYNYSKDENNDGKYQKIKIDNVNKIKEADVRMVFEWNTTEAEFLLEFVNPYLHTYKAENSIESHKELILDQKQKGYTSKEVIIEKLTKGDWFVNLTYLGNKHYKPTILKVTTYNNWGKSNQTKKINVFEFTIENLKTELLMLNNK